MEVDVVECKEVLCVGTNLVIVVGSTILSIAREAPSRTSTTIISHSGADTADEVVEIKAEVGEGKRGLSLDGPVRAL